VFSPLFSASAPPPGHCPRRKRPGIKNTKVGVYYFPNYHLDARNECYFGQGWTEWKLVKAARPRFTGHQQPKVPLWGYTDEADPAQMAQKIAAAASHGIDAFIFDWYYYNDGLFLGRALEEGFLQAKNNTQLKFSLMWANHDYPNVFPYTLGQERKVLYPGAITPQTWERMTDYIITKYFKHHAYWLIDGAPYFSIYDLGMFMKSFGTVEAAAKALDDFRRKTKAAGFSDLHLNAVVPNARPVTWSNEKGEKMSESSPALVDQLKFSSVTSYVWYHSGGLNDFPTNPYESVRNAYFKYAEGATARFGVPYYPNVSMGWDPTPRTNQDTPYLNSGYPHTPIIVGNTPEAFKKALVQVREFMNINLKKNKVLTINAWNEWTEGSYLEPDTVHKLEYLDAVKEVFGGKK